jgi:ankyrin repeat protein
MEAARTGNLELVRALLGAGAHVHLQAGNGWTALQAAENHEHSEVARILRDAGAEK